MADYKAKFLIGSKVRIVDAERLQEFQQTWKYHHKLESEQLQYGGKFGEVEKVAFYHGGDVLYEIKGIYGTWHEQCLCSELPQLLRDITPTSLPPAPRTVRATHRFVKLRILRIISLPFLLLAIAAPFYGIFIFLATFNSTPVPAEVIAAEQYRSHKGFMQYVLSYRYVVAGKQFQDRANVSSNIFLRFETPALLSATDRAVTARFFQLGPFYHTTLFEDTSYTLLSLTLGIFILEGFVAYLFKSYWRDPSRIRWLYRNGQPASGVITRKITKTQKGDAWNYLEFVYELRGSDVKIRVKTLLWSKSDWQRAAEGEVVTVLYDPKHPKHAVAYEYGGYRVNTPTPPRNAH